jgi:Ca2+-binding EF-hand superfamily protein
VIDKDEASKDERGKIAEDFDEIDANGDEIINLEELKAFLDDSKPKKISTKKIIKLVDDNKDGKLNELEIAAKDKRDLIENFKVIDTNKDRELDLEELKAFYNKKDKPKRRKKE